MREEFLYEVFLKIKKSYDALDRQCCMNILVMYGIVPQEERVLRLY